MYLDNLSIWVEWHKVNLKQSVTGSKSIFFLLQTGYHGNIDEIKLPYYLLIFEQDVMSSAREEVTSS